MPADPKDGAMAAVGIVIIGLTLAFIIPVSVAALQDPEGQTLTLSEGENTLVKYPLFIDATNIVSTGSTQEANFTLVDKDTGAANATGIVQEGDTVTVGLGDYDVDVTIEQIIDTSLVTVSLSYPVDIGWPPGVVTLMDNADVAILSAFILTLFGLIVAGVGVFS